MSTRSPTDCWKGSDHYMPSASISSTPASITFLLPLAAIGYPSADNPPRPPPLAPVFSFRGGYAFESLGWNESVEYFFFIHVGFLGFSFCTNAGDGVPVPDRGRSSCSFACFH